MTQEHFGSPLSHASEYYQLPGLPCYQLQQNQGSVGDSYEADMPGELARVSLLRAIGVPMEAETICCSHRQFLDLFVLALWRDVLAWPPSLSWIAPFLLWTGSRIQSFHESLPQEFSSHPSV